MDKINNIIKNILEKDICNLEFRKNTYKKFEEVNWVSDVEGYRRTMLDPVKFSYFDNLEFENKTVFEYKIKDQKQAMIIEFENNRLNNFFVNKKTASLIDEGKIKIKNLEKEDEDYLLSFANKLNKPSLLNYILFNLSVFISLEDDCALQGNVILNININKETSLYPIFVLSLGSNSSMNFVKNIKSNKKENLVDENIFVKTFNFANLNISNEYENLNTLISNYKVDLDKNSGIYDFGFFDNIMFGKIENTINHNKNSSSEIFGLVDCKNLNHIDIKTKQVHSFESSKSNVSYKSFCKDDSYFIHQGLINIKQNSKNIDAYLKSKALLLSEYSKASLIPKLEIDSKDVKCSHGATVSKIDKNSIIYLQTRGFCEKEAKSVLTEAFSDQTKWEYNKKFNLNDDNEIILDYI